MSYPISDVTRRVVYSGSAGTGPYSFSFEVLVNTDIAVYKNTTLLTLTTDYTVTINSNGTGSVTLVSAATGSDNITLVGNRSIERATDFVTGGDLFANTLNTEFDSLVIFTQQIKEEAARGLKAPITDPTDVNMVLPVKASRKGKVLAFDSTTGNPVSGPALDSLITVIEQSDNINTVADSIADVNDCADNMAAIIAAPTNATNAASSASAASSSASDASSSATSALNSAIAAAASAAAGMYSAVQDKSANYTVVAGDAGDLIRVTTTSGAVTITLPAISTVTDGFKVALVKWTGDANAVNIARAGSDTINGATSAEIGSQYSQIILVADAETSTWFASQSGLGATNINVDQFSGNGSTTAFTLSSDPSTENNTQVFISGIYQEKDTYSVSGTTLTFSTAPPTGTGNIEVVYGTPLAIGVPSDGSVSTSKIADDAVTAEKIATGAVGESEIASNAVTSAKIADDNVTPAKLSQKFTAGTAVASTSGTSIDFTSIPSWVKRITVLFSGVSTNGSSNYLIQVGSGSVTTSGYLGASADGPTLAVTAFTDGFGIRAPTAAATIYGTVTIDNITSTSWVASGALARGSSAVFITTAGGVTLSGTLDRVRITTVNGTDTFDAGSINILYE